MYLSLARGGIFFGAYTSHAIDRHTGWFGIADQPFECTAIKRGDLAQARNLNDRIYPLAKAIYGTAPGGYATARLKTCLKLLGRFPSDAMRPPIGPLPAAEVAALERALAEAGVTV